MECRLGGPLSNWFSSPQSWGVTDEGDHAGPATGVLSAALGALGTVLVGDTGIYAGLLRGGRGEAELGAHGGLPCTQDRQVVSGLAAPASLGLFRDNQGGARPGVAGVRPPAAPRSVSGKEKASASKVTGLTAGRGGS